MISEKITHAFTIRLFTKFVNSIFDCILYTIENDIAIQLQKLAESGVRNDATLLLGG